MNCFRAMRCVVFAATLLVAGGLAVVSRGRAAGAERTAGSTSAAADFRTAKREFLQKFRSKQPAERAAALDTLTDVPGREAVELVWQRALADDTREVRASASVLLAGWLEEPQIATTLLEMLKRETRKSGMSQRAYAVVKALAGDANDERQHDALAYLDEFLGTPKGNQRLIHQLADDLGEQADAQALRTLTLLSQAKFFAKNFGYRRCVMQGVAGVPGDETITFLIERIPDLKGQVQYDVIRHLMRLTGENFRDDAASWKAWWAEQQQTLPKKKSPPPGPFVGSAYYGIPIGAKRVVFALDVSTSMDDRGKIDAAKKELCEVIRELPKEVYFGIVAFHRVAFSWQQELMPANYQNTKQAIHQIMAQDTQPGTSSYDALEAALALDPEAIFFVSDGAPRTGKIVNPDEIVAAISHVNFVRRVSIHSIGIGTDAQYAQNFRRFMKSLAEANWGEFREVTP